MKVIQSLRTRHISQCLHLGHLFDGSGNVVEACLDQESTTLPNDAEVVVSPSVHDEFLAV